MDMYDARSVPGCGAECPGIPVEPVQAMVPAAGQEIPVPILMEVAYPGRLAALKADIEVDKIVRNAVVTVYLISSCAGSKDHVMGIYKDILIVPIFHVAVRLAFWLGVAYYTFSTGAAPDVAVTVLCKCGHLRAESDGETAFKAGEGVR